MNARTPPAPRRTAARTWAGLGLIALLAACGGGGGGGTTTVPPVPQPPAVDGLAGRVLLPDFELGRIVEQEPNDTQAQAFRLPPVSPRTVLEVAGVVGVTAARYGKVDPVDALRYHVLGAQNVTLALTFTPTDPISSAPNELEVAVFDTATGNPLTATTGGAQPRTAVFSVADSQVVDVVVTAAFGHAAWLLTLTGADPFGPPKPSAITAAAEPTPPRPPRPTPRTSRSAPGTTCSCGSAATPRPRTSPGATASCSGARPPAEATAYASRRSLRARAAARPSR